jgi:GTPase
VILLAEAGLTTLSELRRAPHHRAQPGGRGAGRRAHGRAGRDAVLRVPPGTAARLTDGTWLGEVLAPGDRLVVARGGRGGRGNARFATATQRAPRHFEKGEPAEEMWIDLELQLVADVGLVGAPNAGKSTLLAALTAARPEVADYPFTTVVPNLGVVALDDDSSLTLADVPGLVEGAHRGRGLGDAFLRHLERTKALVGVVDGAAPDAVASWRAVVDELRNHDPGLVERPLRVVVTKLDLPEVAARWPDLRAQLRAGGYEPIGISAHEGTGLDELRKALGLLMAQASSQPAATADDEVRVHRYDPLAEGWEVVAEGGGLRVRGRRVELAAARTDFENDESRDRFQRLLERLGIDAELRRRGARAGVTVHIGRAELEWADEA